MSERATKCTCPYEYDDNGPCGQGWAPGECEKHPEPNEEPKGETMDPKRMDDRKLDALYADEKDDAAVYDEARRARASEARMERENEALRKALLGTKSGDDRQDGLACWRPSPTYARRHGGRGHSETCVSMRDVLALRTAATEDGT